MNSQKTYMNQEQFSVKDITIFLKFMIILTVTCYVVTILNDYSIFSADILGFFIVHEEASIFTWIHTILLFVASALSWLIHKKEKLEEGNLLMRYGWLFLVVLFLFISADEAGMIHERVGNLYNYLTSNGIVNLPKGYFLKAYAPFMLVTVLFLFFFFIKLYRRNNRSGLKAFAGLAFWISSLLIEKIDGIYRQSEGANESTRFLIRYSTEACEVIGTVILIFSIIDFLDFAQSES